MLNWICPECGGECPPNARECPACAGQLSRLSSSVGVVATAEGSHAGRSRGGSAPVSNVAVLDWPPPQRLDMDDSLRALRGATIRKPAHIQFEALQVREALPAPIKREIELRDSGLHPMPEASLLPLPLPVKPLAHWNPKGVVESRAFDFADLSLSRGRMPDTGRELAPALEMNVIKPGISIRGPEPFLPAKPEARRGPSRGPVVMRWAFQLATKPARRVPEPSVPVLPQKRSRASDIVEVVRSRKRFQPVPLAHGADDSDAKAAPMSSLLFPLPIPGSRWRPLNNICERHQPTPLDFEVGPPAIEKHETPALPLPRPARTSAKRADSPGMRHKRPVWMVSGLVIVLIVLAASSLLHKTPAVTAATHASGRPQPNAVKTTAMAASAATAATPPVNTPPAITPPAITPPAITPPVNTPPFTSAVEVHPHPMAKFVEVNRIRIVPDVTGHAQLQFTVANHGTKPVTGIALDLTLHAAGGQQPPIQASAVVPSLGPSESKEILMDVDGQVAPGQIGAWGQINAEVQVNSQQ